MPTPFLLNGILASQISGHLYAGPAGAFDALGSVTVGSGGQSSITFSAIPQTYTHLQIRGTVLTSSSGTVIRTQVGGGIVDTGSNYARHVLGGSGSGSGFSSYQTNPSINLFGDSVGTSTSIPSVFICDILDYTSVNKNKTFRALSGSDQNGSGEVELVSGAWFNYSSAINVINIFPAAGNFSQYSNFSLYGIR